MELLKPLIALLAIVNPIGALPFFISFTQKFDRKQRQRTIRISSMSAFIVIAVSALAGLRIIDFFGISIASNGAAAASTASMNAVRKRAIST